jgi:hypothetical protein
MRARVGLARSQPPLRIDLGQHVLPLGQLTATHSDLMHPQLPSHLLYVQYLQLKAVGDD